MKKLLAILLALVAVGAVSGQVVTAIGLYGNITVIDTDGNSSFNRWGNGYDTLTFKATDKDGNFGFNVTDQNLFDGNYDTIRDWAFWAKTPYAKFIMGLARNGDFRTTFVTWKYGTYLGAMDRISGYGLLVESVSLGDLTVGLNLPIDTTAQPVGDMLQKSDVGVKYAIKDVGTAYLMANLNLVAESNIVNFGFKFTGVENLTAVLLYKGTFAATSTHQFGLGVYYAMDKLNITLEVDGKQTTDFFTEVLVQADYQVTDDLWAAFDVLYDLEGTYDAFATVDYNLLGSKLFVELVAGYADTGVHYALDLVYNVAF